MPLSILTYNPIASRARSMYVCMYVCMWRDAHPDDKGNIRDYATINQLICLSNMENLNAVFINEGMPQQERLHKLNQIAIQQMTVLENVGQHNVLKA